jgi:hypothetical protein
MTTSLLIKFLRWAAGEAREKLDLRAKWAEIKETSKEWGPRFIFVAVTWELIEDGLFPFLSWWFGVPWLIPVFLIWHFEPVAYPVFFWMFRTYDRITGKTPWEADRPGYSSHWRTAAKVTAYRVASIGGLIAFQLYLGLNAWLLLAYIVLMTGFNFAHERIWHDSNFGILVDTDEVLYRRPIAKALTYRTVSCLLLGGALGATITPMPWTAFLVYQGVMLALYGSLETIWARSTLGINGSPTPATA